MSAHATPMLAKRIMRITPGRSASSCAVVVFVTDDAEGPSFPDISNDSVAAAGAGAGALPPPSFDNQEGVSVMILYAVGRGRATARDRQQQWCTDH